ncbi:geranylgeranyl transferase type-2 subunit alpha, partial [Reticulomyxa filosa]
FKLNNKKNDFYNLINLVNKGCIDLDNELNLCTKFLKLDSRNCFVFVYFYFFATLIVKCNVYQKIKCIKVHCWDYRRFIVEKANVPLTKELNYTTQLLTKDFSNGSAWHYRSTLLAKIYSDDHSKMISKIVEELEFAWNAFYTEPDDQSTWLYHRWLLGKDGFTTMARLSDTSQKWVQSQITGFHQLPLSVLIREYEKTQELLSDEPNARWALLTSAVLMRALHQRGHVIVQASHRCTLIFDQLIQLDPMRKGYYNDIKHLMTKSLT